MKASRRRGFWVSRGYVQTQPGSTSHRKRLGIAAYASFLWFVAKQTDDRGTVNRGRPVRLLCGHHEAAGCCLAHDQGLSKAQAQRDFKRLRTTTSASTGQPYLSAVRSSHGYIVTINHQQKFAPPKLRAPGKPKEKDGGKLPLDGDATPRGEVSDMIRHSSSKSDTSRGSKSDTCQVAEVTPVKRHIRASHHLREEVLKETRRAALDPKAVDQGRAAYQQGRTVHANPYTTSGPMADSDRRHAWTTGFLEEKDQAIEKSGAPR